MIQWVDHFFLESYTLASKHHTAETNPILRGSIPADRSASPTLGDVTQYASLRHDGSWIPQGGQAFGDLARQLWLALGSTMQQRQPGVGCLGVCRRLEAVGDGGRRVRWKEGKGGSRYAGGRRDGRELPAERIPYYRRQTYSPSAFEGFVKKNRIQRAGGKNRVKVHASTNNHSILQFSSTSAITAWVTRGIINRHSYFFPLPAGISRNGVNLGFKNPYPWSLVSSKRFRPFISFFLRF